MLLMEAEMAMEGHHNFDARKVITGPTRNITMALWLTGLREDMSADSVREAVDGLGLYCGENPLIEAPDKELENFGRVAAANNEECGQSLKLSNVDLNDDDAVQLIRDLEGRSTLATKLMCASMIHLLKALLAQTPPLTESILPGEVIDWAQAHGVFDTDEPVDRGEIRNTLEPLLRCQIIATQVASLVPCPYEEDWNAHNVATLSHILAASPKGFMIGAATLIGLEANDMPPKYFDGS